MRRPDNTTILLILMAIVIAIILVFNIVIIWMYKDTPISEVPWWIWWLK